jgi:lysine 2,3-aminomutase
MTATGEKLLRSPADLVDAGLVEPGRLAALQAVASRYAVAITPALAELIDPADPHGPIARQFVPDARELAQHEDERADPIGDDAFSPVEGIVHRYPDRVLLKIVNACAVYCRFCFRREMVGPGKGALSPKALAGALAYIRATPQIWEVILTGGDPLILSPRRLEAVMAELAAIDQRVAEINAEIRQAKLARQRLLDFRPRLGSEFQCPRCWIQGDARATLEASPNTTGEEILTCRTCGSEYVVPE